MRTFTISLYLFFLGAAFALAAIAKKRPTAIAPLGAVLERAFVTRPARIVLVLFWWWLGWHFLVARTVDVPLD
jgi:hypothetical protein